MRILFVSDLHGASLIVRKAITAIRQHNVDVLFLAGDLSGKDLRPIIDQGNGLYVLSVRGEKKELNQSNLEAIEQEFEDFGHYFFFCTQNEFKDLKENERKIISIMNNKILERIESWSLILSKSLDFKRTRVIITPGNDDILEIDGLLKQLQSKGIESNLDEPLDLGVNQVITLDYSNITPWDTSREVDEETLWKKIEPKVALLKNPSSAIFNFHVPPFNTRIDLAPELDKSMHPVITPGSDGKVHVGSRSIRKAIENYQPLLSLHGHIHESPGEERIGRTICLNPGSEYTLGILNGYIIDFDIKGNIERYYRIEG